jgi:hypothetical protein
MTVQSDHRPDFERCQLVPFITRNPAGLGDDDFKAHQKLEFHRWRTAVTIVQHMRAAGITCELFIDPRNGH